MPALLRYFSDLIHFKTSNQNPIPLHGNPVLDNFVFKHAAVADWKDLCHSAFVRVATGRRQKSSAKTGFASAHSCGLRHNTQPAFVACLLLCLSAFARVATRRCRCCIVYWLLCLSAFARVAT